MLTRAKLIHSPPRPVTANDALFLPLEEIKVESIAPLSYLALFMTEASHSTHISSTSSNRCHHALTRFELVCTHPETGGKLHYEPLSVP